MQRIDLCVYIENPRNFPILPKQCFQLNMIFQEEGGGEGREGEEGENNVLEGIFIKGKEMKIMTGRERGRGMYKYKECGGCIGARVRKFLKRFFLSPRHDRVVTIKSQNFSFAKVWCCLGLY